MKTTITFYYIILIISMIGIIIVLFGCAAPLHTYTKEKKGIYEIKSVSTDGDTTLLKTVAE